MRYSKKLSAVFWSVTISYILITSFATAAESENVGTINFVLGGPGDVMIKHKDRDEWGSVTLKMDVTEGDILKTNAESRVEIKLLDDSLLRIGEKTELEITLALVRKDSKKIKSTLKKGKIWANVTKLSGASDEFQIKAPTAVCAVRGTIYRINADSTTTVLVYDGSVNVGPLWKDEQPPDQQRPRTLRPVEIPAPYEIPPPYEVSLDEWIEIVRGFQITVRPDGKYAKSRFDEEQDAQLEWVRWNKQRDQQIRRN